MENPPLTAKDFAQWQPSTKARLNGFRVYASKLFKEGMEFERDGDMTNARLRYQKARSFCAMRQIPYPPTGGAGSPLSMAVEALDPKAFPGPLVRNPAVALPPEMMPPKKEPKPIVPRQERGGWVTEPVVPPQAPISVEAPSVKVSPPAPELVTGAGAQAPGVSTESISGGVGLVAEAGTANTSTPAPSESSSGVRHGPQGEPASPGLLCFPVHETAAPDPVTPPPPAPVAPPVARERKAKVTHFCVNPRLAGITFADTKERASLLLGRRPLRINDEVTVKLFSGTEGHNGIYEQVGMRF